MTEILKDILISAGDIDRYFEQSPVNLWRAKRTTDKGSLFGLVEEDKVFSEKNGVKWVSCRPSPRGISTFDKPNTFKGNSWEYYKIPEGTTLPSGLAIVKDKFNSRISATHYTIAPAYDMPLSLFRSLLNDLAANVVREAI
jgi:hypothetical protein